jgi:hypothetical protein
MIQDFLALENMYEQNEATLYMDEVLQNYDTKEFTSAVTHGFLETRTVCIGPNCGRVLCWLTEKGRCKARAYMH